MIEKKKIKAQQRQYGKVARASIAQEDRLLWEQKIFQKLIVLPEFIQASYVCLYYSVGDEVDTRKLIHHCLNRNMCVALPRIEGARAMQFYPVSVIEDLTLGKFNIPEPKKTQPVKLDATVLVIAPMVVFDEHCNRGGMGCGFYDSIFLDINSVVVGLAFENQKIEKVAMESHDQAVNVVVTEVKVYRRNQ